MTLPDQKIKKAVMNRVFFVYVMRRFVNWHGLEVGWFAVFSSGLFYFVSVPSVLINFYDSAEDISGAYNFVVDSFINTELTVQVIVGGIASVCAFSVFNLGRNLLSDKEEAEVLELA